MTNTEIIQAIKAEIERLKGIGGIVSLDNREQKTGYESALIDVETFLSTLESEKAISPWKKIHTYTEEIHEGDMEKMLLELSVGKGEKRTKIDLPDRIVDILESEKPINPDDAMKELDEKIALVKRRGTWDGVDVDKYMDEVRGREPEKPMGLEKEMDKYFDHWTEDEDTGAACHYQYVNLNDCRGIARHFAEWGYLRAAEKYNEIEYNRQRAEENASNDLEEAARKSAIAPFNLDIDEEHLDEYPYLPIAEQKFIEGAKWQKQHDAELIEIAYNDGITIGMTKQKEQMMKGSVEGEIVATAIGHLRIVAEANEKSGVKDGDKVRIIIVKP